MFPIKQLAKQTYLRERGKGSKEMMRRQLAEKAQTKTNRGKLTHKN